VPDFRAHLDGPGPAAASFPARTASACLADHETGITEPHLDLTSPSGLIRTIKFSKSGTFYPKEKVEGSTH